VADIAQQVAVMYARKIVEQAEVVVLFRNPLHFYTVWLFNSLPRIGGTPPHCLIFSRPESTACWMSVSGQMQGCGFRSMQRSASGVGVRLLVQSIGLLRVIGISKYG
jgi:ABC-type dipeptide/oligopeptide/nickel transport system ATPase component